MRERIRSVLICLLMVISTFVMIGITVDIVEDVKGTTLYVNKTGDGGAYTKIQDAIDDANPGDTVFVYNGSYYQILRINKTINLTGESKENTTLHYDQEGIDIVQITADYVNVTGIKIHSGYIDIGIGLKLDHVQHCNIYNNIISSIWNHDFVLNFSDNNTIVDNIFEDGYLSGLYLESSSNNFISNNSIISNNYYGILVDNSLNNIITNNNFWMNNYDNVRLSSSNNTLLINNYIYDGNYGFQFFQSNNNTIMYNNASNTDVKGITLSSSSYNRICNNDFYYNTYGAIDCDSSSHNNISNNIITYPNEGGTYPGAMFLEDYCDYNTIVNNTVLSDHLSALTVDSSSNNFISENNFTNTHGGINLRFSSNNNTITNNIGSSKSYHGLSLSQSSNNSISDNKFTSNGMNGIQVLSSSNNNTIMNNNCSSNGRYGIRLEESANNTIKNNNASMNLWDGILFNSASNNSLYYNMVLSNDDHGIYLYKSQNNLIIKNNILLNNLTGIYMYLSSNNSVYYNNLINNTNQAYDDTDVNFWNYSYPTGGNYWSDYFGIDIYKGPKQNISGSDGIGDTNYSIDSDSYDFYPYMDPIDLIPPKIKLNNPQISIIKPGVILDFNVSDPNLDKVIYSIDDGAGQPFFAPFNISTLGWTDRIYKVHIWANDTFDNIGTVTFYFIIDSIAPVIYLNFPENNSIIQKNTTLDFFISDLHLMNVNYSINGGSNNTLANPFDISTEGWLDDDYNISINAFDFAGNSNFSSYTFTVDSTKPIIQLNSPLNNSIITNSVPLDFSIIDPNLDKVNYSINEGSDITFESPFNIPTSQMSDGNYTITINALDVVGNSNSSWYFFTIEFNPPLILLNTPSNNSIIQEGTILDFTISDPKIEHVNYSVDGGPIIELYDPYNITTSGWPDGTHIIQINASDSSGNINTSWFSFEIDSQCPRIILISPLNNSVIVNGTILNFDIIDLNIMSVNYSINDGAYYPLYDPYLIETTSWQDDNYIVQINAMDMAGNLNSSWYFFTIDSTPPKIILISPGNNSIIPDGTLLNFDIDDVNLIEVNYSINGGVINPFSEPYDISTIGWSEDDYIIQINIKDLAGNANSSWFMFTIDSTKPTIQLNSPSNNSLICGSTILDFSITDLHLYKVNYTLDGGPTIPLFSPFNISTSIWEEGDHTVQINAVDLAGNSNSSWYFFTMESCPPTIILNFPLNNSVIQIGTILDFYIMDPNLFQVNYSVNSAPETPFYDPFNISTVTWPEGDYFIQINALDTIGNLNCSWFLFTIDDTKPNIQLNHPENNSIIPDGTIIDYLVIDLHLMEVNYSVNGGSIFLLSDPFDISTSGWDEGDCTIQINAIDMAGNQNSSWYFFTFDSIKPMIRLDYPQNNSIISDRTIIDLLVFDLNLMWVNYSVNGGPKVTLSDPYEISTTGWEEKGYTVLVNAIDVAGNSNSSWYFFTIDSTPPSISLNTPKNNSVIQSGTILDFYTMDTDLIYANYSINGDSEIPFSEPFDIQTSSFDDRDYSIQINLIDIAGNTNSFWYHFIIDSTSPSIILITPENNSVIKNGIILDFSIIDTNLLEVYYSINSMGNISFSFPYDLSTLNWPDGNYTIQIIAYDLAGNFNLTSYYFTIDSVKPIIILVNPENNSVIKAGTKLYFTITDQNLLYINYSLNWEGNIPLSEPFEISTESWEDGECKVKINAMDSAGNTNSSLFSFTVDSTNPLIILNTPVNNSIIRVGTILDFNVYDMNLLSANYSIDGGFDIHLVEPFDISPSGLTEDEHTVQINAIDLACNHNSRWFVFTIDSTAPDISFNTELNHSTLIAGETIQIDISSPYLDTVFYSIDGNDYDTLEPPYIITTDEWTEGSHTLEIIARDQVGNEITQTLEIKIDTVSPCIVSTYPLTNARDVERDTLIIITFSEPMRQSHVEDYLTISPYFEFSCHWNEEGTVLTISFVSNELAEGTTYRLKIHKQIADINGNTMSSDFELAFTTKGVDTGADGGETDGVETEPLVFVLAGLVITALIIVFIILWLLFFKIKRSVIQEKEGPDKEDVSFEEIPKESQPPLEKELVLEEIIEDTEEVTEETEFEFMPPPPPPIPPPPPPPEP